MQTPMYVSGRAPELAPSTERRFMTPAYSPEPAMMTNATTVNLGRPLLSGYGSSKIQPLPAPSPLIPPAASPSPSPLPTQKSVGTVKTYKTLTSPNINDEIPAPVKPHAVEDMCETLQWFFLFVVFCLLVVQSVNHDTDSTPTPYDLTIPWMVALLSLFFITLVQCCYQLAVIGNKSRTKKDKDEQHRLLSLLRLKHDDKKIRRYNMLGKHIDETLSRSNLADSTQQLSGPVLDWSRYPRNVPFGDQMRKQHFVLDPFFFNAASYGATPSCVRDCKQQWEQIIQKNPALFKATRLQGKLQEITSRLCRAINSNYEDTVLVTNANQATSAILKAFPWEVGDTLFILSVDYDATKLAARFMERTYGIETVELKLSLPMSNTAILAKVKAELERLSTTDVGLPKLANFCHVTSKTAWIFPAKDLVALFHSFDVPVIVDGAQAAGHLDINVNDINSDWYLGTVHKWMYSCQGVAFLVTKGADKKASTIPLQITGLRFEGFKKEFEKYGDLDYPTWLSVESSFDFVEKVCGGWDKVRGYCREQARQAVAVLEEKWKTKVVQGTQDVYGNMPIVPLPNGDNTTQLEAAKVMAYLTTKNITAFVLVAKFNNVSKLCIRCSCQIYTSVADWRYLGDVVNELKGGYSALGVVATMFTSGPKKKGDEDEDDAVMT